MIAPDSVSAYLDALAKNDDYRQVDVLKSSPWETTDLVLDAQGHVRVRKTFSRESGLGTAYAQLKAAQDAGAVFSHLPRIYNYVATESSVVVVMEYLTGETLWQRIDREGSGAATAIRYFGKVCEAVEEMHEKITPPLIHRDLKPSNILVTEDGQIRLLDFGISRTFKADSAADTAIWGTREYAPPEQFGYRQTDEASDVYSLGMVLYHLFTGQTPSVGLAEKGFVDPDIPKNFRPVLMRATAFDPDTRYGSVRELRTAFQLARQGRDSSFLGELVNAVRSLGALLFAALWFGGGAVGAFGGGMSAESNVGIFWIALVVLFGVCVPGAAAVYLISGKRIIHRLFPALARLSAKQRILRCVLVAVAGFFAAVFTLILGISFS